MSKTTFKANNFLKTLLLLTFLIVMLMTALIQFGGPFLKSFLIVNGPLQHADVLVVMAGSQSERLPAAADLFERGLAPSILLANDGVSAAFSIEKQRNLYQVEWAEEELVELGVPREKIVKLPYYGSATMFDVLAAKKYLLKSGLKKIIIVTSDYHTRRSFWAFRHALKGYEIDISIYPVKSINVDTWGVFVEYAKYVYYILKYGLIGWVPDLNEVTLKKK